MDDITMKFLVVKNGRLWYSIFDQLYPAMIVSYPDGRFALHVDLLANEKRVRFQA